MWWFIFFLILYCSIKEGDLTIISCNFHFPIKSFAITSTFMTWSIKSMLYYLSKKEIKIYFFFIKYQGGGENKNAVKKKKKKRKKQNVSINNLIKRCRFVWLKLKHQKEAAKEIVHKIILHTCIHTLIISNYNKWLYFFLQDCVEMLNT